MTTYKDAGVDIEAGHRAVALMKSAVEATHGPEVLGGLGRFGGLFDASGLAARQGPILVASTDGVGTKTRVAAALKRWDSIGHDIVNHCVNDILVQGAEPLFFLDYVASARLHPEQIAAVVGGAAAACGQAGCALLGGETAEMPGVYQQGELDLVGTIVGVVDRARLIDGGRIEAGDRVFALPSNGLHTNGFTLARKALQAHDLHQQPEGWSVTLGDALLAPHKSYLSEVRSLWRDGVDIRGLVHITGGGLVDNPPRVLEEHLAFELDWRTWEWPPLFRLIAAAADVPLMEMARTFNLGVGMLVVVPSEQEVSLEGAWEIGRIKARDGAPVDFLGQPA